MATTDATSQTLEDPEGEGRPQISAYPTTVERTVFTESGNGDGWIATDLTVEPTR